MLCSSALSSSSFPLRATNLTNHKHFSHGCSTSSFHICYAVAGQCAPCPSIRFGSKLFLIYDRWIVLFRLTVEPTQLRVGKSAEGFEATFRQTLFPRELL